MKLELLIILGLALALALHSGGRGSACGPGGCLAIPEAFTQFSAAAAKATALSAGSAELDRNGLR